jgi:hypothetical protein
MWPIMAMTGSDNKVNTYLPDGSNEVLSVSVDGCRRRRPQGGREPRFRCDGMDGPPCTMKRGDTVYLHIDFNTGKFQSQAGCSRTMRHRSRSCCSSLQWLRMRYKMRRCKRENLPNRISNSDSCISWAKRYFEMSTYVLSHCRLRTWQSGGPLNPSCCTPLSWPLLPTFFLSCSRCFALKSGTKLSFISDEIIRNMTHDVYWVTGMGIKLPWAGMDTDVCKYLEKPCGGQVTYSWSFLFFGI